MAPATLLHLQRTAGNRAVQRLMTSDAFKKSTKIKLAKRGKTLSELDRLLEKYHRLDGDGLKPNRKFEVKQRIGGVLNQIVEVADLWLEDHQDDTSRGVNDRRDGIFDLHLEAQRRIKALELGGQGLKTSKFVEKKEGSASSILENVGKAIGLAIPKPGDSVEVSLDTRIPCDSYGVSYIGFSISASAARMDNKATWISFKAAVTGGAQVAGLANLGGELGLFLEAQGETPAQAMKLISYGWYRQLRESPMVPREVANFMWGGGTGSVGGRRAARWAANVEKEAFGKDPKEEGFTALSSGVGSGAVTNQYVRMGFGAGVGADVGGIAGSLVDVSGSAGVRGGKHYDRRSVAGALGGAENIGKAQEKKARFHTKNMSTGVMMFDAGFGAAFGPFSGNIALALELMFRKAEGKDWFPESYLSLKGSLSATVPANAFLLQLIADGVKSLSNKLVANVGLVEKKAKDDKETKGKAPNLDAGGQGLSTALAMFPDAETDTTDDSIEGLKTLGQAPEGGDEPMGSDALGDKENWLGLGKAAVDAPGKALSDPAKMLDVAKGAFVKPVTLTLMVGGGWQLGDAKGWTLEVSLSQGTGTSLQAGVAGMSFAKSSRLIRFVLSGGGGQWEKIIKEGKNKDKASFGLTID